MMVERKVLFTVAVLLLVLTLFGRSRAQEPNEKRAELPVTKRPKAPLTAGARPARPAPPASATASKPGKFSVRPPADSTGKSQVTMPTASAKIPTSGTARINKTHKQEWVAGTPVRDAMPLPQRFDRPAEPATQIARNAPQPQVVPIESVPPTRRELQPAEFREASRPTPQWDEPIQNVEPPPTESRPTPRQPVVILLPEFLEGAEIDSAPLRNEPAEPAPASRSFTRSADVIPVPPVELEDRAMPARQIARELTPFTDPPFADPADNDELAKPESPTKAVPLVERVLLPEVEPPEITVSQKTPPTERNVPSTNATTEPTPENSTQPPSEDKLADLRPVSQIDVRAAVRIPPVVTSDSPQLRQPLDQAQELLAKRPAVSYTMVPWTKTLTNRNTYGFHHYPLYFEDPNLERCGRGWGCFTLPASICLFYSTIPTLPYRMTAERPHRCVAALPDCRMCERFRWSVYLPPWDWKAAAVQAAATTGFVYFVP